MGQGVAVHALNGQFLFGRLDILSALNPCEKPTIPLDAVLDETDQSQRTE